MHLDFKRHSCIISLLLIIFLWKNAEKLNFIDFQMDLPRVDLLKCQPKDYEQEIIDESNLSAMSISTKDDEDEDSLKN